MSNPYLPPSVYLWIVTQSGEDRIRKWDTIPFPEANYFGWQDNTLERLVKWCLEHGISTGHADSMGQLLDEILPQISAHINALIDMRLREAQNEKPD